MKPNSSKHFFLISFLPAIAYWYLEAFYTLKIALIGGLILAIIEIILEKLISKSVHKISIFNFLLILFLGSFSLLGEDGIWFKLQPSLTGLFMGSYFLYHAIKKESIMYEVIQTMQKEKVPSKSFLLFLEKSFGIYLLIYGLVMAPIAFYLETGIWLFWKTVGFYVTSILFFIIILIYVRKNSERFRE